MSQNQNTNIETLSRTSLTQFVIQQNAEINILPNPKKPGSIFFTCGSVVGAIGASLKDDKGNFNYSGSGEDLTVNLVSIEGGDPVHVLCKPGVEALATLGVNLLR